MYYGYDRSKTDNERYLEDRVRELEEQQERERRDREQAREERMQGYREAVEAWNRSAANWPECLQKQVSLFRREAREWPADDSDFPDDYFGPGADACERALQIWHEIEAAKRDEIEALRQQIEAIKNSIRLTVADQIEAESELAGWKQVADALREYTDSNCEIWLDW